MKLNTTAKCKLCHEVIESTHRHDFKECLCGAIAVDGGSDYARYVGSADNILLPPNYVESLLDVLTKQKESQE